MTTMRDLDVRAASAAAVRCLIDTEGRARISELVAAAGVSRRTWHRYFPAKEDLLRPLLREASEIVLSMVADPATGATVIDRFVTAFASVSGGLFAERTRGLMPVIAASPSLEAVFAHEATLTSDRLRRIIADDLGPGSLSETRAAALAATLTALSSSALREAAGTSAAPHTLLTDRIRALGLQETIPSWTTEKRGTP